MSRGKPVAVVLGILLALSAVAASAADRSTILSLSGGVHQVLVYGSTSDYQPGVNDFPVTPAHRPVFAGLSFGRLSGRWLFELEAGWVASSPVTLEDPSDGDTVDLRTSARATASVAAYFLPFEGRIRPYLGIGGGVDAVLAGAVSATTRNGYAFAVPAPALKDRFDPLLHAGGGILLGLGGVFGLRLDGRYVWVLDRPLAVRGIRASLALTASL